MPREKMPHQAADKRIHNFDEVNLGYSLEQAKAEAARCLNCKHAPCKKGCPVGVQIPEFLAELKKGDTAKAAAIIKQTNSLPAVCGRVCPQEEQCEKLCVRARMDGAVAIGNAERFCGDFALKESINARQAERTPLKAAIIGSGPSALTAAADLANAGFDVTVFEAFHIAGGVLAYGIPEFRLPKALVAKEIDNLLALGVKLELNTIIGKTYTVDQLLGEHDAVFIGSGAGLPQFLGIKGENLNGVYSANEYLTRVNLMKAYLPDSHTPLLKADDVVVFGAGNVAMDAARTALRLGSKNVSIVYRRTEAEMPARKEEIQHAKEEGVRLIELAAPVSIEGSGGRVSSIVCQRMRLGEPDSSGRRSPVAIEGDYFDISAGVAIVAVGTTPNPLIKNSLPDIKVNQRGAFIVDGNMMTTVDRVYAGGDAVTGAATVIEAMGAGRKAAASIIARFCK